MISPTESAGGKPAPRPLKGISITVAAPDAGGNVRALGVLFAKDVDSLRQMLAFIHGQAITVNLGELRNGVLTLEPLPKKK